MKLQSSHLSTLALSLLLAISVMPALAQPNNSGNTATNLTLEPQAHAQELATPEVQQVEPVEIPLASLFTSDIPHLYLTTDLTLPPAGVVPVDPQILALVMPKETGAQRGEGSRTVESGNSGVQSEEVQVPQLVENQPLTSERAPTSGDLTSETPVVPAPSEVDPEESTAQSPVISESASQEAGPNFVEAPIEPAQPGVPEQIEQEATALAQVAQSESGAVASQEATTPVVVTDLTLGTTAAPVAVESVQSAPVGSALVPTARPYTTPKLRPTKQVVAPTSPDLPLDYSSQFQPNLTRAGDFHYPSYMLLSAPAHESTLNNNPPTASVEQDASLGVEFEGVPYGAETNLTIPTPIDGGALPVPGTVVPNSDEQVVPSDSEIVPTPESQPALVAVDGSQTVSEQIEALIQKFLADCYAHNHVPADYAGLSYGLTLPSASDLAIAQAYQACQDQATQVRTQLENNPALTTPNYLTTYNQYNYPKVGVNDYPSQDGHHRFPNNDAAHVWPNPSNPTATAPILVDGTFHNRDEIQLAGDQGLNESTRQVLVPEHNLFTQLAHGLRNTPFTLGYLQNIEQGLELASKDASGQLFNQALIGTDPTQLAHSRYLFSSSTSDVTKYRSVGVPVSPANIGGFWPNPDPSLNNIVTGGGVTLNTWDERVLNPYARLIPDFQPTLTEIGTFVNDPHTGHSRFGVPFEVESPIQPLTPTQRLKANEHRQVTDQQAYLARAYLNGVFAKYYGNTVAAQPVSMKQLNQALAQQGASEFVLKYHLLTIAPITDKVFSQESFDPVILAEDAQVVSEPQGNLDGTVSESTPESVPESAPSMPELENAPLVPEQPRVPAPVTPNQGVPVEPAEPAPAPEDNSSQRETQVHPFLRMFSVYR